MRITMTSLVSGSLVLFAGSTQAASISFNMSRAGDAPSIVGTPYGVVSSSNWNESLIPNGTNNVPVDIDNLVDDSGAATTLDFDAAQLTLSTFGTIPANTPFRFGDSHFPGAAADTWTLSQIPYAEYYIIAYVSGNNLAQGSITDGTTTYYWDDAANKANAADLVEITDTDAAGTPVFGTYAVFGSDASPLTGASQVISWDATGGAGASILNGFQVVEVIPEPSSLALVGLGGLLIARRRRS